MNKTQTSTIIIYGIVVFFAFMSPYSTTFSVLETIFTWPAILGVLIGIIALVKGSVPGWGIHNRKVAVIVIIASFVCFIILDFIFIFLPVIFY